MTWSNWDPLLFVLALLLGVAIGWAVRGRRSTPTPPTPFVPTTRTPQSASEQSVSQQPASKQPTELEPESTGPVPESTGPVPVQRPDSDISAPTRVEHTDARTTWPAAPATSHTPAVDAFAVHDPALGGAITAEATPTHPTDAPYRTDDPATSGYADDPADRWAYDTATPQPRVDVEPEPVTEPVIEPEPVIESEPGTRWSDAPTTSWQSDPAATDQLADQPSDDPLAADGPAPQTHTLDGGPPSDTATETVHTTLDDPARDTTPAIDDPAPEPVADDPAWTAAPSDEPPADEPPTESPAWASPSDESAITATSDPAADPDTTAEPNPVPPGEPQEPPAPSGATAADDFRRLAGVGPKVASALHAAGIHTFSQLADTDVATLREAMRQAGVRSAPTLTTWPEQARTLAR